MTPESSSADAEGAPPLVDVRGLVVRFGRQAVLRDITLAIPRGQTLAVIGESGCGKTVLMKSVIGLVRPTAGQVRFDGHELAKLRDKELAQQRRRFGFVFQGAALFDSLTIYDNVAFPLRQHGETSEPEIRRIVMDRLNEVGMPAAAASKKPAEISGGMRKRVGLARALALDPEIMLYDEPTTGLDPIMSDVINELIISTREHHTVTSIVVTHDMHTADKVADRVVMLVNAARLAEGGQQMIFDGTPEQLRRSGDKRVTQFVRGEAGERLEEIRAAASDT